MSLQPGKEIREGTKKMRSLLNCESHRNGSRKGLLFQYASESKITRHSPEQAQIRCRQEVLLMVVTAKMRFKKPEGNPQKKVIKD